MDDLMEFEQAAKLAAGNVAQNAGLHVTFYMKSLQNNFETEKQGKPVFFEMPFIRIMKAGDDTTVIDRPAEAGDHMRFPLHWAHFKNMSKESDSLVGTPVTEWPAITRAQADEFKGRKFYTVEQIAECSDAQIQALGMNANIMRQKARAFLEVSKNTALAQKQAAELERKDAEIKELKDQQKRLSDQFEAFMSSQSQKKKPGRPKKAQPLAEDTQPGG